MNELHGIGIRNTSSSLSKNLESFYYPLIDSSFDPLPLNVDSFDLFLFYIGGFSIIFLLFFG